MSSEGNCIRARAEFDLALDAIKVRTVNRIVSPNRTLLLVDALIQSANLATTPLELSNKLIIAAIDSAEENQFETSKDLSNQYQYYVCQLALGGIETKRGKSEAALIAFEKAASGLRRLCKVHPGNVRLQADFASAVNNLGQILFSENQDDSARSAFVEAKQILERLASEQSDPHVYSSLGGVLHNLAAISEKQNELEEAKDLLNQAIEYQANAVRLCPDNVRFAGFLQQHQQSLQKLITHESSKEAQLTSTIQ